MPTRFDPPPPPSRSTTSRWPTTTSATVAEGATATIALTANDTDLDGTINPATVAITQQPSAGSLTVNPNGTVTYTSNGTEVTSDSFKYRVNDSSGATSNEATVTITITPVNDAPVAVNDSYSTNEDTALDVSAPGCSANDTDPEGNPLTAVARQSRRTARSPSTPTAPSPTPPTANYNGPDSFTYKANDGTLDSNMATVNLTVNPVNDAPVAANDSYSDQRGHRADVAGTGVLANDTDADGNPLTAVTGQPPGHGTRRRSTPTASFTYTPDANYNGADSFTYTANDGTLTATSRP